MTTIENLAASPPQQPQPLGPWATLGWALLSGVVSTIASIICVAVLYPDRLPNVVELTGDAQMFSALLIVSTVVQIAVLALVIRRFTGWGIGEYFGLTIPGRRETVIAVICFATYVFGSDALTYLLSRDVVTPFQDDLYRSARQSGDLWLMWLAIVVVGPAGEELMFRGFLYRGWARSPRSVLPAMVLISALWSILHIQYDWYGIAQIFLGGLLLGWIRWRSGSTALTTLLHAAMNAWATIETMLQFPR